MTKKYRHIPVLLKECIEELELKSHPVVVDATLGFAGHSEAIARELGRDGLLIGIDQDDDAIAEATKRLNEIPEDVRPEIKILHGNFSQLDELLLEIPVPGIDAILFDLGVSSYQIDTPDRGFSFKENAPLDMRMDPENCSITAAEIVNTKSAEELTRIISDNSDEKWASRIASFIVKERQIAPIETSDQLVSIIKAAIPASARRKGGHPAKRTFQALRMAVNSEQESLSEGLTSAIAWLNPKGRICVISYHSIEDRIVKDTFAQFADRCTCPPDLPICVCNKMPILDVVTRKPILPTELEINENPRARSAKLRVAEKF